MSFGDLYGPPRRVNSGAPWEESLSYCRAIQVGPIIAVSGTTSMKDGKPFAIGDAYGQAMRCFEIIENSLLTLGYDRSYIIRTRMFVTNIKLWEEFGRAHGEFFRDFPPATSMLEVKGLISEDLMIEIEADAVRRG